MTHRHNHTPGPNERQAVPVGIATPGIAKRASCCSDGPFWCVVVLAAMLLVWAFWLTGEHKDAERRCVALQGIVDDLRHSLDSNELTIASQQRTIETLIEANATLSMTIEAGGDSIATLLHEQAANRFATDEHQDTSDSVPTIDTSAPNLPREPAQIKPATPEEIPAPEPSCKATKPNLERGPKR